MGKSYSGHHWEDVNHLDESGCTNYCFNCDECTGNLVAFTLKCCLYNQISQYRTHIIQNRNYTRFASIPSMWWKINVFLHQ